jgi:hypothetical protein
MCLSASTNITILVVQNAERRIFRNWLEYFSNTNDFWRVIGGHVIGIDFLIHVTFLHTLYDSISARPASSSLRGRGRIIINNSAGSASLAF